MGVLLKWTAIRRDIFVEDVTKLSVDFHVLYVIDEDLF
jgi:hypothetical protein